MEIVEVEILLVEVEAGMKAWFDDAVELEEMVTQPRAIP